MDAADAFWAARIVSRFTDEMIHAIVAEARMSDPEAEAYLRGVILERRDKVINYWIARTNPLDEFDVRSDGNGARLSFENAAIRVGAATPGASYSIHWSRLDNLADTEEPYGTETSLDGTGRRCRIPLCRGRDQYPPSGSSPVGGAGPGDPPRPSWGAGYRRHRAAALRSRSSALSVAVNPR